MSNNDGISMDENRQIELGFSEGIDNSLHLSSIFFPSKIGGKPAWLSWKSLPTGNDLVCHTCSKPLLFLCQVYAPQEEVDRAFHRTILVFICNSSSGCHKTSKFVRVYRCQLVKENDFYEPDLFLPENISDVEIISKLDLLQLKQSLCSICGCRGDKKCSVCKKIYCSKAHQTFDWQNGHKADCNTSTKCSKSASLLFAESELVTEPEPKENPKKKKNGKKLSEEELELLNKPVDEKLSKELAKLPENKTDEIFEKFKERVEREPDQVIRYDLGGTPLWVSEENIANSKDINRCSCGAERQFEFQIMPQMLNYLNIETSVESLDWGTIAIYTCADHCDSPDQVYREEFAWVQNFSKTELV